MTTSMERPQERHLKVVLFSDVVGSSERIFADELIAIQHIKEDLALIKETLQRHGGCLVKSLGDGLLATFDAPTPALEFIQSVVMKLNRRTGQSMQHRFGIHVGEIYADGDDIMGQGVHLASRLQTIAPPNGVAFVQSTFELVDASFRLRAELMGNVSLPGLPTSMFCYQISEENLLGERAAVRAEHDVINAVLAGTPFRIARPLGRTGSCRTFLLKDTQRHRHAVLKLFPGHPEQLSAIEVEVACLDRLRNPRIPRILDGYVRNGQYCLFQEWIPGPSLEGSFDYLRKKQRLSELLRQVLDLLSLIHHAGIVHGDIHPGNLIVGKDSGQLFLVDFAMVRSLAGPCAANEGAGRDSAFPTRHLETTQAVGGLARLFFSPQERARFGHIWPGVDLYALGVTALCLHTGRQAGELYNQLDGGWDLGDLDPEVVSWLAPLLMESPGRRLQTAGDALQLLDRPSPLGVTPLPASDTGTGSFDRERLRQLLSSTYGPVVELLLEGWPSLVPLEQRDALGNRLLEAGLKPDDVDAALSACRQEPLSEPPAAMALTSVDASPTDSTDQAALLAGWRRAIGPVADLLLTPELAGALLRDEPSAAAALSALDLPEAVVRELMAQARQERADRKAPMDPAAETAPCSEEADRQLRSALVAVVGPIGERIYADVEAVAAPMRLEAAVKALRGYSVPEDLIQELRRTHRPDPGSPAPGGGS
jgi:class 3 adenylate cyclase/serine/threonine protein kinase